MSDHEIEAIIWCPGCKVDIWRVERRPAAQEGVFENHLVPLTYFARTCGDHKVCRGCGANLERKP